MKKRLFGILISGIMLVSCGNPSQSDASTFAKTSSKSSTSAVLQSNKSATSESEKNLSETELTVHFGDNGDPFTMHLYDNDTASAIAKYVGTSNWRLPIYHYDDYDNWEVMQYYDIPSRYKIPAEPETVTKESAGTVYYSEPNRIVLFYQDAEVSAEYTPVGYFDYSEEFLKAVQDNPVLEGWGNKIVLISDGE